MKKILLTLFLILFSFNCYAQQQLLGIGPIGGWLPLAGGITSGPISTPTTINVLNLGAVCDGVTNVATQVATAITMGAQRVILGPNCLYKPVSNTTPSGIEIIGENITTSIISVANRATDTLLMGARSNLKNVGIISSFCDTTANPISTQKICPVGYAANISDTALSITNWVYQQIFLQSGPQVTGPTGVVSTDIPLLATIENSPGGDGIYTQSGAALASAIRVVTAANQAQGIYVLNGLGNTTNNHNGIFLKELGTGASGYYSQYILRNGASTHPISLNIDDTGAGATYTSAFVNLSAANQTSGNLFNIFQTTTAFSGDAIHSNMGNSTGTFTGNFFNHTIAGVATSSLNYQGNLTTIGTGTFGPTSGNQIKLTGSASGFVLLSTIGAETNIPLIIASKGSQSIFLQSNGVNAFQIGSNPSSNANTLGMVAVGTGGIPNFFSQGFDTNIGIAFKTKGTGGIEVVPGLDVSTAFRVWNAARSTSIFTVDTSGASATVAGTLSVTGIANVATTSAVCVNPGTGLLTYDGTIGTCTLSDARLKDYDGPITNALIKISKINGIRFHFKDKSLGDGQQIGLTAQNVATVFPELVQTGNDGIKSLDYAKLTAPIIEAIKELKKDNDNLRLEIEKIKKKI